MSLQTGISLLILVGAIVGSAIVLALSARRLWHTFNAFNDRVVTALDTVTEVAEATEAHATAVAERTERLAVATERLQESLARLEVLRAAAGDLRRTAAGIRDTVPKK